MSFTTFLFFGFFLGVLVLYYLLPHRLRKLLLLAASYVFYMWSAPALGAVLLGTTLLSYGAAFLIDPKKRSGRSRAWILGACCLIHFGLLFVCKYLQMTLDLAHWLLPSIVPQKTVHLLLPVGISFFTFAVTGYLFDVYRGKYPVERNFLYTAQNPSMTRAREICAALLNAYDAGEIEKIYILYTDLKNGIDMEAKSVRVLPFHRASFHTSTQEKKVNTPFEFFPSVEEVLDALIPSYVSGYIYSALVDSFCSEQSARMNAMSAANDNARSMIEELQGQYNRIRQSAITQEITEITAGSRAIRQGQ